MIENRNKMSKVRWIEAFDRCISAKRFYTFILVKNSRMYTKQRFMKLSSDIPRLLKSFCVWIPSHRITHLAFIDSNDIPENSFHLN